MTYRSRPAASLTIIDPYVVSLQSEISLKCSTRHATPDSRTCKGSGATWRIKFPTKLNMGRPLERLAPGQPFRSDLCAAEAFEANIRDHLLLVCLPDYTLCYLSSSFIITATLSHIREPIIAASAHARHRRASRPVLFELQLPFKTPSHPA